MREEGSRIVRVLTAVLVVALASLLGGVAQAQENAVNEPSGEIAIQRAWFGVGNVARPGEYAGIQLRVNDSNDKPREILIRIPISDADGDKALWEATLTTNPGVNQPVWAFPRLPATFRQTDTLKVYVYEAVEGAPLATGGSPAVAAGRQLGSAVITPHQVLATSEGMLGIVGNRLMGLQRYAGVPNQASLPAGHERLEIVERLDPDILPDRWQGLMQFAAVVWNEPSPGGLSSEKAQAIREWVTRGGHFIIVLPRLAQSWTDEANNPLFDLVPRVRVNRQEGASLEPLRNLITPRARESSKADERLELPTNEVLQTMVPIPGASEQEASCIIAMPAAEGTEAEWLVARRRVGLGMVTLIGMDTASRWMDQHALPDPELFWHRILGRRGHMVGVKESGQLTASAVFTRTPATVDNNIADEIAEKTLAGAGVLMGLVVFVLYWLVAGPLGYAALKKTGRQRHAWVGFVLAAAVFTGIAWGGATIIRPARISASHLTILDHVYTPEGASVQRARAWMSVLIPHYGDAAVALGDPTKPGSERFHNLIAPWEHEKQSSSGFPDARGYRINSRSPDHFTIPTRSTVKQFQVDWAGAPVWKMPRPGVDGAGKVEDITAELVTEGARKNVSLTGTLTHELPGALREVVVVVNLGQKPLNSSYAGPGARSLTSEVFVAELTDEWGAGVPLDLSKLHQFSPGDRSGGAPGHFDALQERTAKYQDGMDGLSSHSLTAVVQKMHALTFLDLLEPPDTTDDTRRSYSRPWIRRQATHGWDLSRWITQPCIIIVGQLGGTDGDAPSPVPLTISTGGAYRSVPTAGITFVRWVYPLPPRPPRYPTGPAPGESQQSPPT